MPCKANGTLSPDAPLIKCFLRAQHTNEPLPPMHQELPVQNPHYVDRQVLGPRQTERRTRSNQSGQRLDARRPVCLTGSRFQTLLLTRFPPRRQLLLQATAIPGRWRPGWPRPRRRSPRRPVCHRGQRQALLGRHSHSPVALLLGFLQALAALRVQSHQRELLPVSHALVRGARWRSDGGGKLPTPCALSWGHARCKRAGNHRGPARKHNRKHSGTLQRSPLPMGRNGDLVALHRWPSLADRLDLRHATPYLVRGIR